MDHKISKDMISSGMIPSGEKTQADLGRTQYGSAPSPSSLMDAYKSIYEHHQKDADGKVIEHDDEELQEVKSPLAPVAAKVGSAIGKNLKKRATDNKGLSSLWHKGGSPKAEPTPESKPTPPSPPVKETYKGLEAAGGHMSLKGNESDSQVMRQALGIKTKTKTKPTLSQDVDLFDLVKGKLIDEGCDEQEALRIMANLSEEERESLLQNINELFGIKKRIDNKLNQMRNKSKIGGNKRVDDTRTNSGDPTVGTRIEFGN